MSLKLHDLRCFDAVARLGSFQAAAHALHRSHPSVFAAVARLEEGLGLTLLDRSGYRVTLNEAGRTFHARAAVSLRDLDNLEALAKQLTEGEETVLRVVLGDLCPRPPILRLLSEFFAKASRTVLQLDYEAVGGPAERLRQGSADIVFHRAMESEIGCDQIIFGEVRLIPVAAPALIPPDLAKDIRPEQLRAFTQCVIRDTAKDAAPEDHFLIDGAHRCTAPDHSMKKEMILHHMGWGHLPDFMIEEELRHGTLVRIISRHLPGRTERLAAIRRNDRERGPVAQALWQWLVARLKS